MGKYDNVTMKEYMKKKKEMLDDLGRTSGVCGGINCKDCPLNLDSKNEVSCSEMEIINPDKALEIVMEYEPKVDWSKAPKDTNVLVRNYNTDEWGKGHFAYYKDGCIWCYVEGKTSFTASHDEVCPWRYAKLYKGDE